MPGAMSATDCAMAAAPPLKTARAPGDAAAPRAAPYET
jgi:hypothetical protein